MHPGSLYAWGKNASGQLGSGNTESVDAPTFVMFFNDYKVRCFVPLKLSESTHQVRSVSCGGAQTLVLTDASEVYQCGYDGFHSNKLPVLVEPNFIALSNRRVAMACSLFSGCAYDRLGSRRTNAQCTCN